MTTLESSNLQVTHTPDITAKGAHAVQPDALAENGVLHAIDQVLIPLDDVGNVQPE